MTDTKSAIACSSCFKNFGISSEATKLGTFAAGICPRCGAADGAKLDRDHLWSLQNNFFIWGSVPTAYYPSPIGLGGADLDGAQFEANTWEDYLLLEMLTGVQLFWHGPATYLLGISLLREKIQARLKPAQYRWPLSVGQTTTIDDLWAEVISIAKPTMLEAGIRIFRARRAAAKPLCPSEYDSPPPRSIRPNRFNDEAHQVFYAAFDVDTCIAEMKRGPGEIVRNEVTVARFESTKTLKLLNLCEPVKENVAHADWVERLATLDGLLFPHEEDYFMSQSLSRYIEQVGFDGFTHPSALRFIGDRKAKNLVLFGTPLEDSRIRLLDINSVAVAKVKYELRFGPALAR